MVSRLAIAAAAGLLSIISVGASPLDIRQAAATSTASSAAATSTGAVTNVTVPRWSWTRNKMHGVALGNWLVLERWMDEQWFIDSCGNSSAVDEWTWSQSLGTRKQEVLKAHWDSYIQEADIKFIADRGMNMVRIPLGYWAFISQPAGTPYCSQCGQLDQVTRILSYCAKYGLYAIIDLHGLPGSQNGEQPSGRIGYNNFYNSENQQFGDQTVDAAISYIVNSPYRNLIAALETCNEPIYYREDQYQALLGYYQRTYAKTSAVGLPILWAAGKSQTPSLQLWQGFMNGKNPEMLVYEDHPYVGRMWGTQDQSYMLNEVCTRNRAYASWPIPVAITEWAVSTDIYNNPSWVSRFFSTQAKAWTLGAGGLFWSYRVVAYPNVAAFAQHENFTLYSFVDIANQVPLPSAGQNSSQYLASLPDYCSVGTTTRTYPTAVASVQPSVTRAFTSGAGVATRI